MQECFQRLTNYVINYLLNCAYESLIDQENAKKYFEKASIGLDESADMIFQTEFESFKAIQLKTVKFKDNEILYPDHGEIWAESFSSYIVGDTVELCFRSAILYNDYKKISSLNKSLLEMKYKILNTSKESLPLESSLLC